MEILAAMALMVALQFVYLAISLPPSDNEQHGSALRPGATGG